jgi:predicted XRE-type DNA-binding protein
MNLVELNHADRELMRALLGKLEQSIASMQAVAAGLRGALQPRPRPMGPVVAGTDGPPPVPVRDFRPRRAVDPEPPPEEDRGRSEVSRLHTPASRQRDAEKVRRWLLALDMNGSQAARALGVTPAAVSKVVHGQGLSEKLERRFRDLLLRRGLQ